MKKTIEILTKVFTWFALAAGVIAIVVRDIVFELAGATILSAYGLLKADCPEKMVKLAVCLLICVALWLGIYDALFGNWVFKWPWS